MSIERTEIEKIYGAELQSFCVWGGGGGDCLN